MISMLRGTVHHVSGKALTLDVHGVGYEVLCSTACLEGCVMGSEVSVVVHTEVKEDLIRLHGFADHLEKQVFLLLMRVKGVGAKSSSDIISHVDKVELLRIIAAGDIEGLQRIKGIGKKTAERIVVELKDKVGEYVVEGQLGGRTDERPVQANAFYDAIEALMALGFSRRDAERSVKSVEGRLQGSKDAGEIVREALRCV